VGLRAELPHVGWKQVMWRAKSFVKKTGSAGAAHTPCKRPYLGKR